MGSGTVCPAASRTQRFSTCCPTTFSILRLGCRYRSRTGRNSRTSTSRTDGTVTSSSGFESSGAVRRQRSFPSQRIPPCRPRVWRRRTKCSRGVLLRVHGARHPAKRAPLRRCARAVHQTIRRTAASPTEMKNLTSTSRNSYLEVRPGHVGGCNIALEGGVHFVDEWVTDAHNEVRRWQNRSRDVRSRGCVRRSVTCEVDDRCLALTVVRV